MSQHPQNNISGIRWDDYHFYRLAAVGPFIFFHIALPLISCSDLFRGGAAASQKLLASCSGSLDSPHTY
eukprot:g19220.t1